MNKKLIAILVLLIGLLFAAYYLNEKEEPLEGAGTSANAPVKKETLIYQGEEYPLKKRLKTVLLIGTDSTEGYTRQPESEQDFFNYHQADYLTLLVLDEEADRTEVIQINRDTITNVPWLDIFGERGGTERKQICLAFNSGDGGPTSCRNTVDAVSALLFDLPIDAYIQMPMVAISQLNDLVGGVPVTIREDMTVVDPEFVQGATVLLTGTQAESFVRARMALADDTNTSRMARHREYMDSFVKCAQAEMQKDSGFAVKVVQEIGSWLQSDLNITQMSQLIENLTKYGISPFRHAAGQLCVGAQFYEFYVDETSLWEIVKNACCE